MMKAMAECSIVFLLPILVAILYNNSQKKKVKANMKVVYYKFFVFCTILFLSSQISIKITEQASMNTGIKLFGNILMALLILENFLIPSPETHPDDVAIIHTSILWLLGFLFVLLCCFNHFPDISKPENGWDMHPIYDIRKISTKVYSELAMPSKDVENLPICNLFSYVKKTGDSVLPPPVHASSALGTNTVPTSSLNDLPSLVNASQAPPTSGVDLTNTQWPNQQLSNNNTTV